MCGINTSILTVCIKSYFLYFRPYLEAVFNALECSENDYEALFALCLLYAMGHNNGQLIFRLNILSVS